MRAYQFDHFGLDHVKLVDRDLPAPGPNEVIVDIKAFSLNYRDLLVIRGHYNPRLKLPATPISDGAGIISAVGANVERVSVGDRVASHFISGWIDGPFCQEYVATTLGAPAAGLAAERVVLPADAVVPIPDNYDLNQAATLPIAALTAWSALVTEGQLRQNQTVLTLGTGGVSIFALQLAQALGARVIITSSSDDKLDRARQLGAAHTINYEQTPKWARAVLDYTAGMGVDVTVETVGAATLNDSLQATRAGGMIAVLGALRGLESTINAGLVLMKRMRVHGVMVDSRAVFEEMVRFIESQNIRPIIDRTFTFDQFPAALHHLESGTHFGKIVVTV